MTVILIINSEFCKNNVLKDIEDTPLIAQRRAMFANDEIHQEKERYRSIQEYRVIKDDELSGQPFGIQLFHLWKVMYVKIYFVICKSI